jgi:hypothetical protein
MKLIKPIKIVLYALTGKTLIYKKSSRVISTIIYCLFFIVVIAASNNVFALSQVNASKLSKVISKTQARKTYLFQFVTTTNNASSFHWLNYYASTIKNTNRKPAMFNAGIALKLRMNNNASSYFMFSINPRARGVGLKFVFQR